MKTFLAFVRFLFGAALLPCCWGVTRTLFDAVSAAAGAGGISLCAVAFLGGMLAFAAAWFALPHPVRAYVFGHELTHALWGLLFGARPSKVRVSASGGSVRLTKTNVLITLAPYFFPFYTFAVGLVALAVYVFVRPLPCLPLWMFAVGFTWAFHILFTVETLTERQPDVALYGRLFSWTFIYMANATLVLAWLAAASALSFGDVWSMAAWRCSAAYMHVFAAAAQAADKALRLCPALKSAVP